MLRPFRALAMLYLTPGVALGWYVTNADELRIGVPNL